MKGRLMAAEMAEQPAILEALLRRRVEIVDQVRAILPHPLSGIVLVARGSSDHAAVYGRYVFEIASRRLAGTKHSDALSKQGRLSWLPGCRHQPVGPHSRGGDRLAPNARERSAHHGGRQSSQLST